MTMRAGWVFALGLLTALAGCEVEDAASAEAMFCNDVASRECDGLALACSRERADCVTIRAAACDTRVQAARTAGRSFKQDNAGPCLTQTGATYAKPLIQATDFRMLEEKCGRVFEGSAGNNDPCIEDADCRGPLICDKRRCGELKTVAAGANCGNPGERCPAEQFCRQGDGFLVCTARNGVGAVCSTTVECGDRFRCRNMACIDKLPLDAECAFDDDCLSSYCDPHPPAGRPRTCATGLNFARFAPSCDAYFGALPAGPDAGP